MNGLGKLNERPIERLCEGKYPSEEMLKEKYSFSLPPISTHWCRAVSGLSPLAQQLRRLKAYDDSLEGHVPQPTRAAAAPGSRPSHPGAEDSCKVCNQPRHARTRRHATTLCECVRKCVGFTFTWSCGEHHVCVSGCAVRRRFSTSRTMPMQPYPSPVSLTLRPFLGERPCRHHR